MKHIPSTDISRFDIGTMITIHRILSERSVTKGARAVGKSQPAASNALARMRKVVGDPLIVRVNDAFVLTARGEMLLNRLSEVIPLIDELARIPTFDPATSDRTFRIGATDHASLLLVPRVIELLRKRAPFVKVSVALLKSGQADPVEIEKSGAEVCLGWLRTMPDYWFSRRLVDDKIVVIVNARSTIQAETFTREDFEKCGHVALSREYPYSQTIVYQDLARAGIEREVVTWMADFSLIPQVVGRTDLIAVFPLSLARIFEKTANIRHVPCPVPLSEFHIKMAWNPRSQEDPGYAWLRELIVEAAVGAAPNS